MARGEKGDKGGKRTRDKDNDESYPKKKSKADTSMTVVNGNDKQKQNTPKRKLAKNQKPKAGSKVKRRIVFGNDDSDKDQT